MVADLYCNQNFDFTVMKKKNPYQSGANWLGKLAVYAIALYNWMSEMTG